MRYDLSVADRSRAVVPTESVHTLRERVALTLERYQFSQILEDAIIGKSGQITVGKPFAGRRSIVILLPAKSVPGPETALATADRHHG